MTFLKRTGTLAFIMLVGVSVPVFAEQPGSDITKPNHEMGGTQSRRIRGKAKLEMYQRLQEMQDHSKTMEGITEQQQLMKEMKKHMRMVDTMMEQMMMQLHRGIPRPQQESGHQDHDAGMEQKLREYYQRITRPQQESERQEAQPGTSQQVEPQASPKDLKQPEREKPHPGEHQ